MKKLILFLVVGLYAMSISAATTYRNVAMYYHHDSLCEKAAQVFLRIYNEKTDFRVQPSSPKKLTIFMECDKSMKAEAFAITAVKDTLTIKSGDSHGLVYGLGHVLHTSHIIPEGLQLGNCLGTHSPNKSVRGIYLATHFHNFYNDAPIEEVTNYIEELALWGYNSLQVWFDMHHYTGIDDPKAQAMLERLRLLLQAGQRMGMKSGLTMLANESYNTTPDSLRSKRINWTGFYGCEICPSHKGGTELILKQRAEMLDAFAKIGLPIDNVWLWPYDQGGCSCEKCNPWGANGYLKLCRKIVDLFHQKLPGTKIVLSTWLFDFEEHDKGEWKGLTEAFSKEKPWVDYIMADSHTLFPRYLLNNPVPGNLPLLNFPEISMWSNYPWGGYGANPQTLRFEKLWKEIAHIAEGGYPYSEGKYEDINKVLYSQFYWQKDPKAVDILKQYVAYEFSPRYASQIVKALLIMEKNMGFNTVNWSTHKNAKKEIQVPATDFGAKKEFDLISKVDKKLDAKVRTSWRWRIIYLRAYLDLALRESKGQITPEINKAFKELKNISSLNEKANFVVCPPAIE